MQHQFRLPWGLPLLGVLACLSGCSTTLVVSEDDGYRIRVASAGIDPARTTSRRLSGIGQASLLYARSVHVEPVVRPVSYASAGASLLFKSLGGSMRRLSINLVRKPSLKGPLPPVAVNTPMDLERFERELDRVTGTRRSNGTIEFLVDGDAYFDRLETALAEAQENIDIRTYIFDNDDYAVYFARLLKTASQRDIRVRIMFDSLGTLQAMQVDPDILPRDFHMPLSIANYLQQEKNIKVRTTANPWLAGDHTKTTIIDSKIAYVGGMNIGSEYRYVWHDLMMEVRGPVVGQLQHESDKTWSRAGPFGDLANLLVFLRGANSATSKDGYPLRVLQTRNFDSDIYKAQLLAIKTAKQHILIENAYFSDDRILFELARARRRGVDVRVILPKVSNHGPMNASNRVTVNELLKHGIRVYLYPGMSHVKAAIYDGWACVGSANFDKLSLQINKELNLATSHPEAIESLMNKVFLPDLMQSEEVLEPLDLKFSDHIAEFFVDEAL